MKRVPANRVICFLVIAAGGLSWDLYSKHAVFSEVGYPGRSSEWIYRWFDGWMTYQWFTSFNEGALWGIGQGFTWVFATLSAVAVVGVLYWLFVMGAACSLWLTLSLSLIMAGTLGNFFDRMGWHGCVVEGSIPHAVRDFLLFTFGGWHYPVFNFADVFLVTGAGMLLVHSFQAAPDGQNEQSPTTRRTDKQMTKSGPDHTSTERTAMNTDPGLSPT